ncbi:MAG: hypothetical protein ACI9KE_004545 [Polyangiales bacterium]|jgi:hypothetical protein
MKRIASIWFVLALVFGGCHADPDDPAGQAEELSDPVRRENALTNLQRLYTNTLADNDGDRASEPVRNMADAIAVKLNQAFLDNPTDNQNRLTMLDLMSEMRDERTVPALIEALDWRPEVNEEHAIRAARALGTMDIPNDGKAAVVEAIAAAIRKVTQARPVDNRLRIELLRSLGALDHESAQPVLVEIALRQDESQNFLINRLAAQQLGNSAGQATIQPMIKALFLFAPSNPGMRMNDVAAEVLVRVGQPAVAPLLAVLNGTNAEANEIAEAYIEAVRARDAGAAEQMSVRQITGGEATFTLGALGFREAMGPLLAETEADDMFRRVNGSIALVRLNHNPADRARVREALMRVYTTLDDDPTAVQSKAQLVAAMRSLYDGEYIPFFREQAAESDLHPVVRLAAVTATAMLADKAEAEGLQAWIASLDRPGDNNDDPYFQQFQQGTEKAITIAIECDSSIPCYIGKLSDTDVEIARKAAFMLGRLGRGNADVITALVEKLGHPDVAVRLSVVAALDRVATEGSQAAVDKIDELRDTEEGRSVWTNFSREALPIQARLRARAGN